MKAFIVLCTLVALTQGACLNHRIVGGEDAKKGQFPYMASLRRGDFHFCGATIISRRTLVCAAHCYVYSVNDIVAVVGTNHQDDQGARRYNVEKFIIHPHYDANTITNDVAVIILSQDIEFTNEVAAAPLASGPMTDDQRLTTSGWGLIPYLGSIPNKLQWMLMNVVNSDECKNQTGEIVTGKICALEASGEGICSGNSGGPLANSDGELVGITSAFLCARGLPNFFTDVYYFKDWILDNAVM